MIRLNFVLNSECVMGFSGIEWFNNKMYKDNARLLATGSPQKMPVKEKIITLLTGNFWDTWYVNC